MNVQLALDPHLFHSACSIYDLPEIVARLDYPAVEFSPKADFLPSYRHPRIDDSGVKRLSRAIKNSGVEIASIMALQRWSGPDERLRQAAVRSWRRTIQIAVDMGVQSVNTEFDGRPDSAEICESQFMRSMDEILPLIEREGIRLAIEPHPNDFIEDGLDAINLIRGLNSDSVSFLYCTPHAFHQSHSSSVVIGSAAAKLRHVHLADAWDHRTSGGRRYVVNPKESSVRVHQHMEMGRGEVDFDEVFSSLGAIGFEGIISSVVFGWEDDADGVCVRQRDRARALMDTYLTRES